MKSDTSSHALAGLKYEAPFYELGADYWAEVAPLQPTGLQSRWQNAALLQRLGLPENPPIEALISAFGSFERLPGSLHGPLAQRYIGYQFRMFNPHLGDGRGFLLAQIRGVDGRLWDLGTKGSGTTPYSRGGDGRLTLKGAVREIIAAEFLHATGVKTSRPLSIIEHRQDLYRGDEPSPTRAAIMVRMGESHVRFGSFERIFYLVRDPDEKRAQLQRLLDHVVETYYPSLVQLDGEERVCALFEQVVQRTASLVAGWMKAGFTHGVLNTDNMNVTGDSFDYGPFAFMEEYDPEFTAAYFDQQGLYAFEAQGDACAWNLAMLARPLGVLAGAEKLQTIFETYGQHLHRSLQQAMLPRMGFEDSGSEASRQLLGATFHVLREQGSNYHGFFRALGDRLSCVGVDEGGPKLPESLWAKAGEGASEPVMRWRAAWLNRYQESDAEPCDVLASRCRANNPLAVPYRREIERVWAAIDKWDDWQPFYDWMEQLMDPFAGQA